MLNEVKSRKAGKKLFKLIGMIVNTLLIVHSASASTNVSGTIGTDTVWNTAGSPYIVTGNVVVDTLITLTIQPGVEVKIDSAKYIMVKGTLNASATATDSIIITKNGTARWDRLWFKPASSCSLKYCRIEYANSSAIYNDGGSIYISYNTISNNSADYGGGIYNYYGGIYNYYGTMENN